MIINMNGLPAFTGREPVFCALIRKRPRQHDADGGYWFASYSASAFRLMP